MTDPKAMTEPKYCSSNPNRVATPHLDATLSNHIRSCNEWQIRAERAEDENKRLHRDITIMGDVLRNAEADNAALKDAAEMLWVVLANVSEGDWTKQTTEWQVAAARWRNNYFTAIAKG